MIGAAARAARTWARAAPRTGGWARFARESGRGPSFFDAVARERPPTLEMILAGSGALAGLAGGYALSREGVSDNAARRATRSQRAALRDAIRELRLAEERQRLHDIYADTYLGARRAGQEVQQRELERDLRNLDSEGAWGDSRPREDEAWWR